MHFNELLDESGAFEKFKSFNFSFEMVVVLSARTEKVRVIRTFDADGPEKYSSYRKFVLQLFVLTEFFFTVLNAGPIIWPANDRTNELFVLSEVVLTRFDCCPKKTFQRLPKLNSTYLKKVAVTSNQSVTRGHFFEHVRQGNLGTIYIYKTVI